VDTVPMNVEVFTAETRTAGSAPCTMVKVPPERGWADDGRTAPPSHTHSVTSAARARAGGTRRFMMSSLSSSVEIRSPEE
jgi:hypothetical protein